MSRKIVALEGSELVSLVKSREFRSRLAEAARITMRTGHESGFRNYRDLHTAKRYWSPVIEGGTDEVPGHLYRAWEETAVPEVLNTRELYPLFDFHFHPEFPELKLSYHDLDLVKSPAWERDVRPAVGIGNVSNDGYGNILFLRQLTATPSIDSEFVTEQAWAAYEPVEGLPLSSEYANALAIPGYLRACVSPFRVSARYADIHSSHLKDLRSF